MSSNMIKAYSIAYDTKKRRVLETEEREKQIEDKIQDLLPFRPFLNDTRAEGTEDGFVPGLPVEDLGDVVVEEEQAAAQHAFSEVDIEALKESLREEITNEIAISYRAQGEEILANARAQAEGLVEASKKDAETAKESILKLASAQGYEEGLKRAKQEEERAVGELEAAKIQLQQDYERQVSELEPAFVKILSELLHKVTGVTYEHHKEVLLYLIETALGLVQKDTGFTVYVSEEDFETHQEIFPELAVKYQEKFALEFKKDAALKAGDCRLENENRVIEAGLGKKLEGLTEELDLLGL